jgi:hypothetical protein
MTPEEVRECMSEYDVDNGTPKDVTSAVRYPWCRVWFILHKALHCFAWLRLRNGARCFVPVV